MSSAILTARLGGAYPTQAFCFKLLERLLLRGVTSRSGYRQRGHPWAAAVVLPGKAQCNFVGNFVGRMHPNQRRQQTTDKVGLEKIHLALNEWYWSMAVAAGRKNSMRKSLETFMARRGGRTWFLRQLSTWTRQIEACSRTNVVPYRPSATSPFRWRFD